MLKSQVHLNLHRIYRSWYVTSWWSWSMRSALHRTWSIARSDYRVAMDSDSGSPSGLWERRQGSTRTAVERLMTLELVLECLHSCSAKRIRPCNFRSWQKNWIAYVIFSAKLRKVKSLNEIKEKLQKHERQIQSDFEIRTRNKHLLNRTWQVYAVVSSYITASTKNLQCCIWRRQRPTSRYHWCSGHSCNALRSGPIHRHLLHQRTKKLARRYRACPARPT